MSTLVIVVAVVVLLVVAFVVWQRRAVKRQADAIEKVGRGVRELRVRARLMPTMNRVSEYAGEIPPEFASITEELQGEGFRMIGDVEEMDLDGQLAGRLRWFTSA